MDMTPETQRSEKAFCKAECRRRYLVEEVLKAREEKRRAAASELRKKEEVRARKMKEECNEGNIFFICPLNPRTWNP
uniref:FLZ-type domain-containing protein n=1 Tax=Leersia perrieri TaxID=77586 RepID=A0A0D9X1G8_9ORYZ